MITNGIRTSFKNKRIEAVINAFWENTSYQEKTDSSILKAVNEILSIDINIDESKIVFNMFDDKLVGNILIFGLNDESTSSLIYGFVYKNKGKVSRNINQYRAIMSNCNKDINLRLNLCSEVFLWIKKFKNNTQILIYDSFCLL